MTSPRFSYDSRAVVTTTDFVPPRDRPSTSAESHLVPVAERALEAAAPNAIYLPQPYEPKYAYPLIVWLQPTGCRVAPLNQVMPVLSERNYLGTISRLALSVSNPAKSLTLSDAATNGTNPKATVPWNWLQEVRRDVLHARRNAHVHSERIYLAGTGPGATAAIQLLLAKPEWFAGAIALDANVSLDQVSLRQFRGLAGKRLFTSSKSGNSVMPELGRLCHLAGLDVTQKSYRTSTPIHRRVLLDVDSWIMSSICQLQFA
jgi:phospholipase/carboxylesterase